MPVFRLRILLFLFAFVGLGLTSCQKEDDAQPQLTSTQQLTSGSWRLDQIKQNGQVTSSGGGIKDQYSLAFRSDGTYTQKLLADNTTYNGTWMLMTNNTILHLTDHKSASHEYTLVSLTASELRYSFTNKASQTEELVFSAQK